MIEHYKHKSLHSIDSFTYFVTNGTHNSNNATVTLSVNSINDAPIARNDTASTLENTPVTILVLNNDSDIDGDLLTVNSITQGTNGTITTNGTAVTYTPKLNFNGTDSFTYTISDGANTSNSAMVTVIVTSIDDEHGEHNNKVNICHKYKKTISVSENAISAHLKHGDVLGRCNHEHDGNHNGHHEGKHEGKHDEITNNKVIKNQIKALKKDFKAQEKELKNQLKD
ncbi:MAG: Ig-like domain-containing protein, partial [Nitrosarchaeum sp.]|nr:Ig-like domain-containing protein [Nitrosarchaeum sp.]